jgi:hypothetical protein
MSSRALAAQSPEMPAPTITTVNPLGRAESEAAVSRGGAIDASIRSSSIVGPYSSGTSSSITTLNIRTSMCSDGDESAGGVPLFQSTMAA